MTACATSVFCCVAVSCLQLTAKCALCEATARSPPSQLRCSCISSYQEGFLKAVSRMRGSVRFGPRNTANCDPHLDFYSLNVADGLQQKRLFPARPGLAVVHSQQHGACLRAASAIRVCLWEVPKASRRTFPDRCF